MPSTNTLKAHLYRVNRSEGADGFTDVLNYIDQLVLRDRIRMLGQREFRMEQLIDGGTIHPNAAGYYFFNIMHFREGHGPGRAGRDRALSGLNYQGDGPGEDTAAIYDPQDSCIIIQYNHNGPRFRAIYDYVSSFCANGVFEFLPRFDLDFERKFRGQRHLTKVEAKVDISQVTRRDVENNVSMLKPYEAAQELGGETLTITIAVDGRQQGNFLGDSARDLASMLKSLGNRKPDSVTKLESKGPVDNDRAELIDLLGGKLTGEREVAIDTADFRMTIEDRWLALFSIYSNWKRDGLTQ